MGNKYPRRSHYLKFQKAGRLVQMKHILTEEEWEIPATVALFIKSLDGKTDPYSLLDDSNFVEEILEFMDDEELFDFGERITKIGIGSRLLSLWVPDIKIWHRIGGFIWNHFLMMSWLPVLIIGVYVVLNGNYTYIDGDWWGILIGLYGGFALGIVCHELSHAAATLNYGGMLFELGIMTTRFMPGAYCMIDYVNVKDRFQRAQINAAGVECNVLFCGCFLCMLKLGWIPSEILLYAAGGNAFLALINLSLIDGLDGNGIFEEFMGCIQFVPRARALIFDRKGKTQLKKKGINGRATIVACYIICALQILLPMLIFSEVISIIGMFFMC